MLNGVEADRVKEVEKLTPDGFCCALLEEGKKLL